MHKYSLMHKSIYILIQYIYFKFYVLFIFKTLWAYQLKNSNQSPEILREGKI